VIDVDLLSVIRRWHGRDKLSIREISRRTGLSRHTIRKYLASGVTEPKYPPRKNISKLDPFADKLSIWLKRESQRSRKHRRSLKQLHRDLVVLGFDGSYDRVAAFARNWRQRHPNPLPLTWGDEAWARDTRMKQAKKFWNDPKRQEKHLALPKEYRFYDESF